MPVFRNLELMIKQFIAEIPDQVIAVFLAFCMSAFRVYMDKSETRFTRIFIESCICGGLTMVAASVISAMELDQNYVMAAGGMIGYLGSNSIRMLALKLANKKIGDA